MSRILRLPLNAELPHTCMSCPEMATHRVPRTFRGDGKSHRMNVPACPQCALLLTAYPRYQRWCGLLIAAFFAATWALFFLKWFTLGTVSLLAMVPAGLHFLYYHWRFERDCVGLGKNFILLRVRSERFVQARDASLPQETFPDWYERLRCEGESRTQISQRLEACGYPTREAYERMAELEGRRRTSYRLHGLRRFLSGSAWSLVGLVGVWFFPVLGGLLLGSLQGMAGGLYQMVAGTGYSA